VLPNAQVLLAAAAVGTQPLAFQWFRGGVLIPEGTNDVLVVEAASVEYLVRVTNIAGSTLSTAARIELSTEDVDGDGIPDLWEISNGLNPANPQDASSDGDGDGASNLHEYLAGTDPRNAQSALRLAIAYDGQVRLQVQVPAGKTGVVQARADLTAGAWDTWAELPPSATNQTLILRPGSAEAGFFRLKLQPSP
jgi:hypothetical protein